MDVRTGEQFLWLIMFVYGSQGACKNKREPYTQRP